MFKGNNLETIKYSNVDLFEKRMKEKEKLNTTLFSKHLKSFSLSNKSKSPFDLTYSTLPSSKRTIFSPGRNKKKINPFNITQITFSKKDYPNNNIHLFLTDTPLIEKRSLSKSNKRIFFSNPNDSFYSSKNKNKNTNNSLLYLFERKFDLSEKKKKTKLQLKMNQMNRTNQKVRDYINKTRDIQLIKYTTIIQKERKIRLKETYDNKIQKVDDAISTINETNKLFCDEFLNKYNEFVKHSITQRETERTRNIQFMEQIIQLKNEISFIESKIRKVELDKKNILKWIYFQICVNEKKLKVPNHYKVIIQDSEENFKNNLYIEKKEKNIDISLNNNSLSPTLSREFHKNSIKRNTIFLNKKKYERNDTKINNRKESIDKSKTISNTSTYKNYSKEEVERIRKYSYTITFSTIEDFIYQFKQFENMNINYIHAYNDLSESLIQLKKEKNLMILEWKKEMDYTIKLIEIKENELKEIKNKNQMLLNEINHLKGDYKNNYNDNFNYNSNKPENKIYLAIISLYKKYSQINFYFDEIKIKRILTKEDEMLSILKLLEFYIDKLKNKLDIYKRQNQEEVKNLQNNIEKLHKVEKSKRQREEHLIKIEKLKEKIEKRNNKIYLLPKKKYETYFFDFDSYKNKKKDIDEKNIIESNIEDYI